jgi:hypothetical protein
MDALLLVPSKCLQTLSSKQCVWQLAHGFATVQDSLTLKYQIIADRNIVAATAGRPTSTILTTLQAYDSTFHNLWSNHVMLVHDDMLWTLPPPADHFRPTNPPPRAARPPTTSSSQPPLLQYAGRNPPARDGASKRHREFFVASQGMLKLAAPVPSGQRLMTYIFKAMPDNTPYPKLTDTAGKPDCLLCFHSGFPAPHNSCQLDTSIAAKRRKRENQCLNIDLGQGPWRSKPETYWQPVVTWLKLPGVDALIRPTAAFKQITPSADWT